jgi:hypothetical protein
VSERTALGSSVTPLLWAGAASASLPSSVRRRAIDAEQRRGDPETDQLRLAGMLERLDAQRKRAQDLALEGLLTPDELRERLAGIEEQRGAVSRELESILDRSKRIERLERDREAILIHRIRPDRYVMDLYTPEQKNALYRRLRLKVAALPDGGAEIMGLLDVDEFGGITLGSTSVTNSTPGTGRSPWSRPSPRSRTWCGRARCATSGSPTSPAGS